VSVESEVAEELTALRAAVGGVDGAIVATSDGLLVAHMLPDVEQSQTAALISAVVGLARHAVELTGRGELREASIRGTSGHVVIFAVGDTAVLAVMTGLEANLALLQLRARPVVRRLTVLAPRFVHFTPHPAATV
jgi:predicted regulator of Ras-like GTPase activity (Roadblock/LC7/MglB family)